MIDFFFFQAEDGIRDKLVTGVQTCALPIYLAGKTPRADLKRLILERKLVSVASAYMNAGEPNAIVGLLDMLVMTRLLREVSEEAWFAEMFSEHAPGIVIKLRVQEQDIWTLALRYVTEAQLEELRDVIDKWRQAHPGERYVSMVRVSDFPQAQSSAGGKGPAKTAFSACCSLTRLRGLTRRCVRWRVR